MNFQGPNNQGQGMYPFTSLPVLVPTVSASTSTVAEEEQSPIVNQVFDILKDIQKSFPGDSEKCKEFLQQMGKPHLLDEFLAIHEPSLSKPAENVTPVESKENSGPYYEDISEDEDMMRVDPIIVVASDDSNHYVVEDLPSQSNDCHSESNDSLGQRNELPSVPSHTTDFLSESKDSLSQNNDNDDLDEDSADHLHWVHASALRRSDRVRDKQNFPTNTNVTPKPTRGKRRRNMSEPPTLSATETSNSEIKIGNARRVSKRGRPRGKPMTNWEATICGVANEMSMLESSQETMTVSENSGTAIGLPGSPLFFSTLTSESSLIQPKRVDIRDLQQRRTTNSLTPILHAESEIKGDDKGKKGNLELTAAGSVNIKSGVGRGRKKKNLNFLQMLSTLGKKTIPVRGRPKKQTALGSKNTLKSNANAWRQKQVKKALFISPKNARRLQDPKDFFAKVQKNIGDTEDYRRFLRCVSMLNEESISSDVFLNLVYPYFNDFPDLYHWLQKFLVANKTLPGFTATPSIHTNLDSETIVVSKLPKFGKSYRALPPHYVQPICSGRTDLCNSVLNDEYVCVPPHSRGGPNARMARKLKITNKRQISVNTQTEEGRYEVDLMIEIGTTCIIQFERILKKMSLMSQVMLNTFQLGALLGGHSQIIPSFIIQLYGKTVGPTIVDALNMKPVDSVPIVLPRIRGKVEEWREAQKKFNQKWRDQVENGIASQINDDVVILD